MRRFLPKVVALVLGMVWLISNSSFAQIQVSLPTNFYSEREVSLPVSIQDVSQDSIYAFLFTLSYDAGIFEITGVEAAGDIAEDFAFVLNTSTPGAALVTGAHYEPLQGEGTLFRITGQFINDGTTDLVFDSFMFNEGNPCCSLPKNGRISNTTPDQYTKMKVFCRRSLALKGKLP